MQWSLTRLCIAGLTLSCARAAPVDDPAAEPLDLVPTVHVAFEVEREVDGTDPRLIRERVTLVLTPGDLEEERIDLGRFEGRCRPVDPVGLPGARGALLGLACDAGRTGGWLYATAHRGHLVVRASGYDFAEDTPYREMVRLPDTTGQNLAPHPEASAALADRDRGIDGREMRRFDTFLDLPTSLYAAPGDALDLERYVLLEDLWIGDVPCKKLAPFALDWALETLYSVGSCTLATDTTLAGLSLHAGTEVRLWPTGALREVSSLPYAQRIDGILAVPRTRVGLDPEGRVERIVPAVPISTSGVHCDAERVLRFDGEGEVVECTLARDSRLDGVRMMGGTRFSRDGRPYMTLAATHELDGLELPAGTTVHFEPSDDPIDWSTARIAHFVPSAPIRVDGRLLAARHLVSLDLRADRPRLRSGVLGEPWEIAESTLPYGTRVTFDGAGDPEIIVLDRDSTINGEDWARGSAFALEEGAWTPRSSAPTTTEATTSPHGRLGDHGGPRRPQAGEL